MINTTELKHLLFWIVERESIRMKRQRGEKAPWTKDPILAKYRFCNVVRNDDRVTRFIHSRLSDVWNGTESRLNMAAFNLLVSRWFNEPKTLTHIGWPFDNGWNPNRMKKALKELHDKKEKIFRASYIINSANAPKGTPKYVGVVDYVLLPAFPRIPSCIVEDSCEESHANLMALDGMGSFMAGQVVADWHACHVIQGRDALTWAPIGPGSRRGLNVLHGRPVTFNLKQKPAVEEMIEAFSIVCRRLPDIARRMTLHDMQNCFCEFSKYRRGYGKQHFVAGG